MLDIPEMLYEISSLVFFLVPMVALVVLYTRMGLKIRRQGQQVLQEGTRENAKKVMLKMLGKSSNNDTLANNDDDDNYDKLALSCAKLSIGWS